MPTLHGYEVRTYWLSPHEEIDVLRAEDLSVWVPGPQVAVLSGDGHRADGRYSTSDVGRVLDKAFVRREPDPHKLYSRTRVRSATLFSLEGLVQKTCHTTKSGYLLFCLNFIERVLPNYQDIAARNAELIWFWHEALDHLDATGKGPSEAGFRAALAKRDARLADDPNVQPVLILGTAACEQVVYHNDAAEILCLVRPPLPVSPGPTVFPVGRLRDASELAEIYRAQNRDALPVAPSWRSTIPAPAPSSCPTARRSSSAGRLPGRPARPPAPPLKRSVKPFVSSCGTNCRAWSGRSSRRPSGPPPIPGRPTWSRS